MTKINDQWAVVVLSCDSYSDLWPHFAYFFDKYWPDCPFKIYLITNELTFRHRRIKTINTGKYQDWSTTCKRGMEQISQPYIFILLEDYLLRAPVPTAKLLTVMKKMMAREFNYCVLRKRLEITHYSQDGIGVLPKGLPYRVNVGDLYRKSFFQKLLIEGESAWNFEIMGSYRASYAEGLFCYKQQLLTIVNGVGKGKWFREGLKYCLDNGLSVDLQKREVKESGDNLLLVLQNGVFNLIWRLPWRWRVAMMNFWRKLLISY